MTNSVDSFSFHARSLLFVPGDRPERFRKAIASGADAICIDLEDAVAPSRKNEARAEVARYLAARHSESLICVRINGLRTPEGLQDLLMLREVPAADAIVLPKTESSEELRLATGVSGAGRQRWIALIESALGLEKAAEIAVRSPDLTALMFGGADFSASIAAAFTWDALLYARQRLACAAGLRGLPLIDVPFLDLEREADLLEETRRVAALGFACKAAIHPRQVPIIQAALTPTAAETERAHRIVQAAASTDGGVLTVDGTMVDGPVLANARRVLLRADGRNPE